MVNSQFSLSWDSYKSNVCNGFSALQQNGEFVDMTIAADGHFVKVHQMLVALASPYLKDLITSAPCQHPIIFLNNVSHRVLCLLLEYIYTGEAVIPAEYLTSFAETAKTLHIRGLENFGTTSALPVKFTPGMGHSDQTEISHTSTPKQIIVSADKMEEVGLPARKIFLKKPPSMSNQGNPNQPGQDDMHDYSDLMDDSTQDSDDAFKMEDHPRDANVNLDKPSSKLQFTVSIRGSLQIILNRYIYNLHSTKRTGLRRWRCVDYRNNKCSAYVVTRGNVVLNRANLHNHTFHDKKILSKIEKKAVYSAIEEVELYKDKMEEEQNEDSQRTENTDHTETSIVNDGFISLDEFSDNMDVKNSSSMVIKRAYLNTNFTIYKGNLALQSLANMFKILIFLCITLQIHNNVAGPLWNKYEPYLKLPAVELFREYLRIDTSNEENIQQAIDFWCRQMTELGIPYAIYSPAGSPIFVATIKGSDPSLSSIMLNSHMDVVKADPDEWQFPPFEAHMDANGNIYARGTQDTKDVGIQYLEAVKRLRKDNVTLARTLHITLMPDEEMAGKKGMKVFAKTPEFKALNIGFALDEGLTSADDTLYGTFVDRRAWQMEFVINGEGGHGYTMPDNSAAVKAQKFINTVMAYRDTQKEILKTKSRTDFTGYTSVNVNILKAGLAINIIPSKVELGVDMRLSTDADVAEMDAIVQSWMQAAGNDTELTYYRKETDSGITSVDNSNPFWVSMRSTLNKMGMKIMPVVCPATSDMLVVRNLGIPAIGFATKTRTISRIHGKDEYQNVETFLKGIDIYTEVIKNLANVPCEASKPSQKYYNKNKSV
ncbi:uncharacterized protein LOC142975254 [Anticarsia gemmatalis]|uniref:uncharacterized protein LOC142975254 n=1 Tax=Anticarsia gemmatalis TaxID=129554 RepID=UPI003F762470